MPNADKLREADEAAGISSRLRAWAGLNEHSPTEQSVRDWMSARGAIPVTLGCAALAVYLIATVILDLLR